MGRPIKELDPERVFDVLEQGLKQSEAAALLDVSIPTLKKRIIELQQKHGILLKYRAVQSLQLTEMQAKILQAITEDKIVEASLKDLIFTYKTLKSNEQVMEGLPSDIKGLVGYLVQLEKRDGVMEEVIDITPEEQARLDANEDSPDDLPKL